MTKQAGFGCSNCHTYNEYPGYVFAHWNMALKFTCQCGEKYTILRGNATKQGEKKTSVASKENMTVTIPPIIIAALADREHNGIEMLHVDGFTASLWDDTFDVTHYTGHASTIQAALYALADDIRAHGEDDDG